MLIKGTALLWLDDQEMELSEGGIVFLPKNIPHAYRVTSKKADLLMINTPAGIEGMFRHAGRDKVTPRPDGFEISPERLAEGADMYGRSSSVRRADLPGASAAMLDTTETAWLRRAEERTATAITITH